ncbi:MATE family efflux transporter [candidate division KSB1 bacterium]|nr:MATE family efflux transporter [candidate division KSB1 bacterium]
MKTMNSKLTDGSIGNMLFRLTIPMLLATISMVIFNLVDTYFVGKLGTLQLAALTYTFPVVMVISSLALGLGMGASALISRAIGEGDSHKVQCLTTSSLLLALTLVIILVAIGVSSIEFIFRSLGADNSVLPMIKEYMEIWYGGVIFVIFPMVGNNAIRATGDTKTPSLVMGSAAILNLIFDPILIFGMGPFPALGIRGAALATVIARFTTFIVAIYVLYFREKMITIHHLCLRSILHWWKDIMYIGIPTAGTRMIIPLAVGVITRLLSSFGPNAVAGFGIASRVEFFALVGVASLASVLGPFIGQNLGARKFDRIKTSIRYSNQFSIVSGLAITIVLAFLAKPISLMFNDNPQVVSVSVLYLIIVPFSYTLQGVNMLSVTTLNVFHKPIIATVISMIQMFVLYIPLAYLLSKLWGIKGIFFALAMANILIGILAQYSVKHEFERLKLA